MASLVESELNPPDSSEETRYLKRFHDGRLHIGSYTPVFRPSRPHRHLDDIGHTLGIFVLPKSEHPPTGLLQLGIRRSDPELDWPRALPSTTPRWPSGTSHGPDTSARSTRRRRRQAAGWGTRGQVAADSLPARPIDEVSKSPSVQLPANGHLCARCRGRRVPCIRART